MEKTAGIKATRQLTYQFIGELKQSALLFDTLGVPQLDFLIKHTRERHQKNCERIDASNDLEYLKNNGLVFDCLAENTTTIKEGIDSEKLEKEFKYLTPLISAKNSDEIVLEATARLSCLLMNSSAKNLNTKAIPIITNPTLSLSENTTKTKVINLVIEQMPIPDEATPWERIFEFKNNPDNKGKFAGLRMWINKTSNSEQNITEIKDELEYLIYQYSQSMKLHDIKHNTGILQSIVIGGAELVENLATLKFSKVASGLFSAQQSKLDLFNTELTAPGKEVAYIYKARQTFK